MKRISLKDILLVIQKALNSIDNRLLGHGEKVAYIMYKLLRCHGGYTEEEIVRITALAVFHDIGAYKVEERKEILEIDLDKPMNHAAYGYLFIKHFSPLSDLAEIVLGHHLFPKDIKNIDIHIPEEALLLNLADNISILQVNLGRVEKEWILNRSDDEILPEHRMLFDKTCREYDLLEKIKEDDDIEELYEIFDKRELSRDEVLSYIRMLNYSIDFRSEATILHNIIVEEISVQICNLLDLDEDTLIKIKMASMLHDIGKIVIPINILEKPGSLTPKEFEIIKSHAIVGYNILSDIGIDDIRNIATLHHEKLNGEGYPFGLKGDEISKESRIVSVADVVSALIGKRSYKDEFPKEKVISILSKMASNNEIDREICSLIINNYDCIIKIVRRNTKKMISLYKNIMDEYEEILSYFENRISIMK